MSGKENKDTAAASSANPPPSTAPSAVEAIEEDDEFEEFEPCQWNANDEDAEDSQQWQVSGWYVAHRVERVVVVRTLKWRHRRALEKIITISLSISHSLTD